MMGWRGSIGFGLFAYLIIMMGAVMGANAGYEAETVNQTNVVFHGDAVTIGGETEQLNTSINESETSSQSTLYEELDLPELRFTTRYDAMIREKSIAFAETMLQAGLVLGFAVADVTATLAFYIKPIVPQWLVSSALTVAAYLPVVGIGLLGLSKLSSVVE